MWFAVLNLLGHASGPRRSAKGTLIRHLSPFLVNRWMLASRPLSIPRPPTHLGDPLGHHFALVGEEQWLCRRWGHGYQEVLGRLGRATTKYQL